MCWIKQTKLVIQIPTQKLNRLSLFKQQRYFTYATTACLAYAYNRIFRVRQIIFRIYFHSYHRICVRGKFTENIKFSLISLPNVFAQHGYAQHSSVSMETSYGLGDCIRFPAGTQIFFSSSPRPHGSGATQPLPMQWVCWAWSGHSLKLSIQRRLVPRLGMRGASHPLLCTSSVLFKGVILKHRSTFAQGFFQGVKWPQREAENSPPSVPMLRVLTYRIIIIIMSVKLQNRPTIHYSGLYDLTTSYRVVYIKHT
jgi:hypothetical protein